MRGCNLDLVFDAVGMRPLSFFALQSHDTSACEKFRKLMGKSYEDLRQERCKASSRVTRVLCRVLYRCGSKHPGIELIALLDRASLLISAVVFHCPSQVRWLADVVQVPLHLKNKLGMTALDIARKKGYTVIESILLQAQERAKGVEDKIDPKTLKKHC